MACSAAATVLAVGALTTRQPASVAAWRSTLSIPTPARPTTRSRPRLASSTSRVTLVPLRTMSASNCAALASSSAGDMPYADSTSANSRSTASPASLSFSATSTAGLGHSAPSDPAREIRCPSSAFFTGAGDDRVAHRTRSRWAPRPSASEDGAAAGRRARALAGVACGLGRIAREAAAMIAWIRVRGVGAGLICAALVRWTAITRRGTRGWLVCKTRERSGDGAPGLVVWWGEFLLIRWRVGPGLLHGIHSTVSGLLCYYYLLICIGTRYSLSWAFSLFG
jgi:hypothetical protein